ncbi:MAG TPA: DUF1732 domain-containing protein, partial [Thermoanaerobaculia bacterium]|nr:DUF1732 domain-containing protein [Thermoanaerobaculia bacterium]
MITLIVPLRGEPPGARQAALALAEDGVEVLLAEGEGPRGARLAEAAGRARGDVLLFLHADTALPPGWRALVEEAVARGAAGGAFRLAFAGGGARMAFVAFWANVRTALTRVPYGDQAPFVRRDVYERLGGHRPWPLLEDVDFAARRRRAGRVALLPAAVRTSPRRYLEKGILRTVLMNKRILAGYPLGKSPEELARLESHCRQFEELTGEAQAVGRKLDFLLQEMAREVNTLVS